MDKSGEIATPKNKCRHLGLRRTIERPKQLKTPLSDIKINYKSLQKNEESSPVPQFNQSTINIANDQSIISSPSTPCVFQNKFKSAYIVNSLPSRFSLSSRAREKYRKKKLEFSAVNTDAEHQEAGSSSPKVDGSKDLVTELKDCEKLIASHEKHQEKVKELTSLIETWKDAFKASLEELSSKIEPKMETDELLARLGIDPEMIEYT